MSIDPNGRAWLQVDPSALRRNLETVRASVGPDVGLVPMVKADAYGLGMASAMDALEPLAPWGWGVATVEEGTAAAARSPRPVVVFSPVPPGQLDAAVDAGLRVSVSDGATLDALAEAARAGATPRFHLEIDTGMGRAGVDPRASRRWEPALRRAVEAGAVWEGAYTHLHSADDDPSTIPAQAERFDRALAALHPPPSVRRHLLNSAGALVAPQRAGDLVRPGIFLYGGRPGASAPAPRPVASLRARVIHVRDALPGDTLGYGSTHVASGTERWATAAIGYGDGLPRVLSNRGFALVAGRRARIIGRISMDVTVVDISDLPSVVPGDVVTFLGRDGDEVIELDELADLAGTIGYEILTGLTPRLPRIWETPVGS